MRSLIGVLAFVALFASPVDARHQSARHGKTSPTEPAPSPPAATALQVVDVNGTVIGHYLGRGLISRDFDGVRVDFCCMTSDGTSQADVSVTLIYSDEACAGTPHLFFDDTFDLGLFRDGSVLNSGEIVFAGERLTIHARSVRSSGDPGCWIIEDGGIPDYPVARAVFVPILELGAAPFSVK